VPVLDLLEKLLARVVKAQAMLQVSGAHFAVVLEESSWLFTPNKNRQLTRNALNCCKR